MRLNDGNDGWKKSWKVKKQSYQPSKLPNVEDAPRPRTWNREITELETHMTTAKTNQRLSDHQIGRTCVCPVIMDCNGSRLSLGGYTYAKCSVAGMDLQTKPQRKVGEQANRWTNGATRITKLDTKSIMIAVFQKYVARSMKK